MMQETRTPAILGVDPSFDEELRQRLLVRRYPSVTAKSSAASAVPKGLAQTSRSRRYAFQQMADPCALSGAPETHFGGSRLLGGIWVWWNCCWTNLGLTAAIP